LKINLDGRYSGDQSEVSMTAQDELARLWRGYSKKVYGSYSPLNSALAAAVANDSRLLEMVRSFPPHGHDPNMLLAAVQYLVLGGTNHPFASLYGPSADLSSAPDLLGSFCASHAGAIRQLIVSRRIQTNEVGRSGPLGLALAAAARRLGEPLNLVDAGASAGLNLLLDEYFLDFGSGRTVGPAASPVHVSCALDPVDLPVPQRLPALSTKVGLDREPVDLTVEPNVRWLLACIWPGTGRHDRARAAMKLAAGRPGLVRQGDMVGDLGPLLASLGNEPVAVVTSWAYSYLPVEVRSSFQQVLQTASLDRPVAWVSCDGIGVVDLFQTPCPPPERGEVPSVLGLAVFDGGSVDATTLAYVQPHGAWISWLDPEDAKKPRR
jgi:hypothetical protein